VLHLVLFVETYTVPHFFQVIWCQLGRLQAAGSDRAAKLECTAIFVVGAILGQGCDAGEYLCDVRIGDVAIYVITVVTAFLCDSIVIDQGAVCIQRVSVYSVVHCCM
jgi:hypothetical protein